MFHPRAPAARVAKEGVVVGNPKSLDLAELHERDIPPLLDADQVAAWLRIGEAD